MNAITKHCGLLLILLISISSVHAACEDWVARVESVEHSLQVKHPNDAEWQALEKGQLICPGQEIKTGNGRAAIRLFNESVLRLNSNTYIKLANPKEEPVWLKIKRGFLYLLTRTPQRFEFSTPYVTGSVDGTEFSVSSSSNGEDRISVYEGQVSVADNTVTSGYAIDLLEGRVISTYPIASIGESVQWALYYTPILSTGNDSDALSVLAAKQLYAGQVNEAKETLAKENNLSNSNNLILQSLIALTQNNLKKAKELLQNANKDNPSYYIASSYIYQAEFKLQEALQASQKALNFIDDKNNKLDYAGIYARHAELALMNDQNKLSQKSITKALQSDNQDTRVQTTHGFILLRQLKLTQAKLAFSQASEVDPANPLAQLGAGLIDIRKGQLKTGREKLEHAATLAPNNALIRSYLGKAYYEENRDNKAREQFKLSIKLDPNDPTPQFYDAILDYSNNQPSLALDKLQKSQALNDNRAIYRSRLRLDEDAASRNSSLGIIYNRLNFNELASQVANQSLALSPNEHGSHQLLAESYRLNPRFDTARSNEILQAQVLQTLTASPIQSILSERDLVTIDGAGPNEVMLNEYNALFNKEGPELRLSAIGATNDTRAGEWYFSGLSGNISYALGQYRYDTQGYRENNALDYDIKNAYLQWQIKPELTIFADIKSRQEQAENIDQLFSEQVIPDKREENEIDSKSLGLRFSSDAKNTLLVWLNQQDVKRETTSTVRQVSQETIAPPLPFLPPLTIDIELNSENIQGEDGNYKNIDLQWINKGHKNRFITGFKNADIDSNINRSINVLSFTSQPAGIITQPVFPDQNIDNESKLQHFYHYFYRSLNDSTEVLFGAAYSDLESDLITPTKIDQWNYKLGLSNKLSPKSQLDIAAFRTLGLPLDTATSLEPTQISTFNQIYDSFAGSDNQYLGLAYSYQFINSSLGLKWLKSRSKLATTTDELIEENFASAYFYWQQKQWALSSQLNYSRSKQRSNSISTLEKIVNLETYHMPTKLIYSYKNGLSLSITSHYLNQKADFNINQDNHEETWLLDTSVAFNFNRGKGNIKLEIKNIADKHFDYLSTDIQDRSLQELLFIPERTVYFNISNDF